MPLETQQRRFWYCSGNGQGHVVGEIVSKELDVVGRVTALLVYECALEAPSVDYVPRDRGMIVTGYKMPCTICGREFEWYPSLEALKRLLRRYEPFSV